jgi:hypothetical protein
MSGAGGAEGMPGAGGAEGMPGAGGALLLITLTFDVWKLFDRRDIPFLILSNSSLILSIVYKYRSNFAAILPYYSIAQYGILMQIVLI